MCEIYGVLDKKEVTVYKVVIRKKYGKLFYSIYTGMKYKIGKVPIITKTKSGTLCTGGADIEDYVIFSSKMVGKVSGFCFKRDAQAFMEKEQRDWGYVISRDKLVLKLIKVKLSGEILSGGWNSWPIYAGSHIDSIELI